MFSTLLPLPKISSLDNIDQVLSQPRHISNKSVHVLLVFLAMLICVIMFSAQLWDISSTDVPSGSNPFADPVDAFARAWDIAYIMRVQDRKLAILISTPITFLLCTVLLSLMRGTTLLRMLLSSLICFGIGIFFLIFSICSVQFITLMGVKMPMLSQLLTLVSLLPIPLLSAVFIALAYSNLVQVTDNKEGASLSRSKMCRLIISIILAIVFLFVSSAAMTSSNLTIMYTMQGQWNSTTDHKWDKECRNENQNYHNNDYYDYNHYDATTPRYTDESQDIPEKCYGKQLDHQVEWDLTQFSITQLFVTESVLMLCLFVLLTGRRISKKSLFIPGILLFASAISTVIFFFTRLIHYEILFNIFFILNSINNYAALIIGLISIFNGAALFVSFVTLIFKVILSISLFVFIIILAVLKGFLKLANLLNSSNLKRTETNEEPEVEVISA